MDGYIGEVKMFAGPYAPVNWLFCQGQTLAIAQYNSLYAIVGTTYGGDGITNFNLPDLRGRGPLGAGNGPNLTPRAQGQSGGAEHVVLQTANMPVHTHTVNCDIVSTGVQLKNTPVGNLPATFEVAGATANCYGLDETTNPLMKADMVNTAGNSIPHENMSPWTCINYIINYNGMWPPRS